MICVVNGWMDGGMDREMEGRETEDGPVEDDSPMDHLACARRLIGPIEPLSPRSPVSARNCGNSWESSISARLPLSGKLKVI